MDYHKINLLIRYVEMIGEDSILEVGCGDLEVFAHLPALNYTGIDASEKSISVAKLKKPEWLFKVCDIENCLASSFDYVFCINALTYELNEVALLELACNLVRVARKGIIFSTHIKSKEGCASTPLHSSHLMDYIKSMTEISSVYEIGSYSNVTLHFAEKVCGEQNNKHDIGLQELVVTSNYLTGVPQWKEFIAYSRDKIGFFPRSVNRIHEFLWLIKEIGDCSGKIILDLGAGVCFLPFYFAERGNIVTTVDNHSIQRNNEPKNMWNGWGFLNYGVLDCRIQSFNIDICRSDFNNKYDIVYSLAMFSHMPAEIRRAVMAKVSNILRYEGLLFLSLDLIPGSRLLWNTREGQIVDKINHGSLETVKEELSEVGIEVLSEAKLEGVPMSRTDVGYLVCRKCYV